MTRPIKPNLTLQVPWCLQLFVLLDGLGKLQRLCRKRALGLEVTQGKNHLWSPIKYKNSPATANDAIKCYTGLVANGMSPCWDGPSQHKCTVDSPFLNLATDRGEWSVSRPGRFISPLPGKKSLVPTEVVYYRVHTSHNSAWTQSTYCHDVPTISRKNPIHTLPHCSYYQPQEPNPHTATLSLLSAAWTQSTQSHCSYYQPHQPYPHTHCHTVPTIRRLNQIHTLPQCSYYKPHESNPHTATLFLLSTAWTQSTHCHTVPTISRLNPIHTLPHFLLSAAWTQSTHCHTVPTISHISPIHTLSHCSYYQPLEPIPHTATLFLLSAAWTQSTLSHCSYYQPHEPYPHTVTPFLLSAAWTQSTHCHSVPTISNKNPIHTLSHCSYYQPNEPNPHISTLFLLSAAWTQSTHCHTVPTISRMNPIHTLPHCSYYQPYEPNPHTATLFLPSATWALFTQCHTVPTISRLNPIHTLPHCSYYQPHEPNPHTLPHCSYYEPHEPNPHTLPHCSYYQPHEPYPHTVTLFLPAATKTRSTPFHTQSTPRHTVPLTCFYVKSNVRTSLQQAHLPQRFHRTLSKSLLSQEMITKPNTHFAIHCSFSLAATLWIRNTTRKSCTNQFNCKIKT